MKTLDRRQFLGAMGRYGAGTCAVCAWGGLGLDPAAADTGRFAPQSDSRRVDFYEPLTGGSVVCGVCPRHCALDDGETGMCRSRVNVGGTFYPRGYGRPCILRTDPIEKVPLNHFRPGTKTMTIATGGCNLRCLYCQNWEHSQSAPDELQTFDVTPEQAVQSARDQGLDTIAFNYTEPVAFLEYATDVARAARQAGLRVVAATGGFIEPEPLVSLAQHLDAITIGLKGFTEEFYETVCGIRLEPVLEAIKTIKTKTGCWLELVNLIVPTYNDDLNVIRKMCGWIRRNVGLQTPVHFARFVPMYRLANLPRTSVQTLESACAIARRVGINYVYTSNIAPHDGNNTYCRRCGENLIQRLGFKVLENHLTHGRCPHCHADIPGIWA